MPIALELGPKHIKNEPTPTGRRVIVTARVIDSRVPTRRDGEDVFHQIVASRGSTGDTKVSFYIVYPPDKRDAGTTLQQDGYFMTSERNVGEAVNNGAKNFARRFQNQSSR
jgi:hypothetical protein